jgi:hypothetical protein
MNIKRITKAMQIKGNQTHNISFTRISILLSLRNFFIPIGETLMGVTREKYLFSIKGERRAMPRPPLVKASRIP